MPTLPTRAYTQAGLVAATQYSYRVRAFNGAGSSGYSNVINATTAAALASVAGTETGQP